MKTKNQEVDKEIKKSRKWQTEVKKFTKENKVGELAKRKQKIKKLTKESRKWQTEVEEFTKENKKVEKL